MSVEGQKVSREECRVKMQSAESRCCGSLSLDPRPSFPLAPRHPTLDTHGFFLQETTERMEMKLKRNSVFSVSSW
jgi:hypothetical protein